MGVGIPTIFVWNVQKRLYILNDIGYNTFHVLIDWRNIMMLVQELIFDIGYEAAMKELAEDHGIKIREYDNYVMLNYDQIESKESDPYAIECRSLILYRDGSVASRSFDRFFNYGQMPELIVDFDWNSARCFEKADGSLIKIWFDKIESRWEISTRSLAMAEGDHVMGGTFRDWVLNALGTSFGEMQDIFTSFQEEYTYIFEYTGPENRIVTRYDKSELVLLAIRHNDNGSYCEQWEMNNVVNFLHNVCNLNVRMVKSYDASSFEDVVRMSKELPALDEGYVVWDMKNNIRVKIKNPAYVAIHHIRDNGSLAPKRVCELILMNEHEEYLSYFGEDRPFFTPYIDKLNTLLVDIEKVYSIVKDIETQRDFALEIKDLRFSSILFTARKLGVSPTQAFNEAKTNYKIDLLIGG